MWSSWEFGTVTLDDGFAMGYSMMPQKKNPGQLELMRGRAGRMIGLATAGMAMMKGLPSDYNRDFHEEKELLVESFELIQRASDVIPPLVRTTTINTDRMAKISAANFANATELANYLVHKHKQPFRHAHDIVGTLVGKLNRSGQNFMTDFDTCVGHLKEHGIVAPPQEIRNVLDPKQVMLTYNSYGGTGKRAVSETLDNLCQDLAAKKSACLRPEASDVCQKQLPRRGSCQWFCQRPSDTRQAAVSISHKERPERTLLLCFMMSDISI